MKSLTTLTCLCLTGYLTSIAAPPQQPATPVPPGPQPPVVGQVAQHLSQALAHVQEHIALAHNPVANSDFAGKLFAAIPTPPPEPPGPAWGSPRAESQVTILQSSNPDPQQQSDLEEDLAVMSRVFERAVTDRLGERPPGKAMGVDLLFLGVSRPAKALYLEDYGVVFNLDVRFPLLPPPETDATPDTPTEREETEWEAARQELYGATSGVERLIKKAVRLDFGGPEAEPYNQEKVGELQDALFNSFKLAPRIRHLKDKDYLLVCVQGPASSNPSGDVIQNVQTKVETRDTGKTSRVMWMDGVQSSNQRGTTMTIRVTRSDAEAFAQGALDLAALKERAQVQAYIGRPNPGGWLQLH